MTKRQLKIMKAGREAQLAAQREQHQADVLAFRKFLADESRLFEMRAIAARELGRMSPQFVTLDAEWREALRNAKVPSDAAFAVS